MKVYIDPDFKCHVSPGEDRREVEAKFFDGKCDAFVEGYRYVPADETWTRADGVEFTGKMIAPWVDYETLYKAQLEYELAQLKTELVEYESALTEIEAALGTK